jgi:hypothetical protein
MNLKLALQPLLGILLDGCNGQQAPVKLFNPFGEVSLPGG